MHSTVGAGVSRTRMQYAAAALIRQRRLCLAASFLACLGLLARSGEAAMTETGLQQYQGRSRVLLVFAPGEGDPALSQQRSNLKAAADAMRERDLVVLEVTGFDERAGRLRKQFQSDTGFFAVLIGKDGGIKLTSTEPLPAARLAKVIDAMPMRRQEAAAANGRRAR